MKSQTANRFQVSKMVEAMETAGINVKKTESTFTAKFNNQTIFSAITPDGKNFSVRIAETLFV